MKQPDGPSAPPERLRSFGRRQSRKATDAHRELRERLLPQVAIVLPEEGEFRPAASMPTATDIWLEIGFGDGGHLAAVAARHPEILFLGCEPFWNGISHLLGRMNREGLSNIRIWPDDARLLLDRLPAQSLGRAFILFPDPWPKLRHRRRRLVNAETIGLLARAIRPGGELLLVSDHADYVASMLETMQGRPDFRWAVETAADFSEPPQGWVRTKYQVKAEAEGRQATYLRYVRTGAPNVQSSA